ncbi:hypothetical protein [Fluviicola taffensis]|uniref:hypothetical protein n=1 Tax=Fluviicola taffensis TaxID=191579 RepID=UPI0031377EB9
MNGKRQFGIMLLFLLFMCINFTCLGQNETKTYNPRKFRKEPIWIEMMNDPNANYFQTIKAFREYWKDRVLPEEPFENHETDTFEREVGLEQDEESREERKREHDRKEKKRKRKGKPDETLLYASQVRAFKGWIKAVKPWVREDGSIVSPEEQQKIIDAQSEERKKTEELNSPKK